MNILNALLADLDNTRRMLGGNVRNFLANPQQHFVNSLTRYAHENLPTQLEAQDAQSVMPGMGDAMTGKVNSLAMNALMPLGTVHRINGARLGTPSLDPPIMFDGQPLSAARMKMSPTESALANMYLNRISAGIPVDKAAEATAMWGAFHPQIGPDAVSGIMHRFSVAPSADVISLRGN
jgi:hypothetical protein